MPYPHAAEFRKLAELYFNVPDRTLEHLLISKLLQTGNRHHLADHPDTSPT